VDAMEHNEALAVPMTVATPPPKRRLNDATQSQRLRIVI